MKKLLALISACAVLFTASITTGCGKNGGESNMGYNRANIIRSLMFSETTTDLGEKTPFVGLSDPSAVGIDATRFNEENLVSVNESDYDVVLNAENFGVNANDRKDDASALAKAVATAKEQGDAGKKVLLKLPAGEMYFSQGLNDVERDYAVSLLNVKNVTVLGNNTMFTIVGAMSGFHMVNCESVAIKGISYDYGRAPFSMGEIVSSTETSVVVKIKDNYPMTGVTSINDYLEFDKYTHMPRTNGNFLLSSDMKNYSIDGQNLTINFRSAINKPVNGTLVVVSHYTYGNNGFYLEDCKDVTFENIDVFTTAGMGLVGLASENLTINRFNLRLKPDTDRLMTSTADGMHFGACRGTLKVTNCLIENTHDDAINVKAGHYFGVSEIDYAQKTLKLNKLNYMHRIAEGDTINFYKSDLEFVDSIKIEQIDSSKKDEYVVIKTDKLPQTITADLIVANRSTAPRVTFENNVIRNKRNRGVLLQSADSVVRNNAFFNVGHGSLSIMTEASQFNEAIVPENILVENNKFIGGNSMGSGIGGDIGIIAYGKEWISAPAGTIKNVTINNNFIANTAKRAISVASVGGLKVTNNLIYNPALSANTIQNDCAVAVSASKDLRFEKNYVIKETPSEKFVTLFTDGTVAESEITLSGNKNLDFAKIDISVQPDVIYALGEGKTIDMTTSDLNDFADVDDTVRIVGYTDAYGKEVTPAKDNFEVKTLKVTYDAKGIYIGFEVIDNELKFSPESSFWTGDLFELFFTPETESRYGFPIVRNQYEDTAQVAVTPSYCHVENSRTSAKLQEKKADAFKYKAWTTADGWAGKLFISFDVCSELKAVADEGGVISMAIVLADMDTDSDRLQVSNTQHNVETNKCIPLGMGKIKFGK